MDKRGYWILVLSASLIMMITMGVRLSLGLYVSPINSATGLGIVAVSYDLHRTVGDDRNHAGVQAAIEHARRHFADPLRVADLAEAAGLTASRLERSMRRKIGRAHV